MTHDLTLAPRPCPICETDGEVIERGFETTMGGLGPHDSNCVEGKFLCDQGHYFYAATQYVCSCGWSGVKDCRIGGHDRLVPVASATREMEAVCATCGATWDPAYQTHRCTAREPLVDDDGLLPQPDETGPPPPADPNSLDQHAPGAKLDAGKPLADLVLGDFARALEAVVDVGTFGANKYTERGWLSVPEGHRRYADARVRHYLRRRAGEDTDPESGLLHLAHEAWNVLAELELALRESP